MRTYNLPHESLGNHVLNGLSDISAGNTSGFRMN